AAPQGMVNTLQRDVSHYWHEHPDRLYHIKDSLFAARSRNRRPQQIIQTKNVCYIKLAEACPAIPPHRRIPTQRTVTKPCREINALRASSVSRPSERRSS